MAAKAAAAKAIDPPITPSGPRVTYDLIGHIQADAAFQHARASGRLHHAWLLTGPSGIGKATLAFRWARQLLAETAHTPVATDLALFEMPPPAASHAPPPGNDPDHPTARLVAAGSHPALLTIGRGYDAEKKRMRMEIPVDAVRQIAGFQHLTASDGGWRVVLIDDADLLNRNAANALLKQLEEPPAKTVLLLVCHALGRLPETLRSRCRHVPLNRLSDVQVETVLSQAMPDLDEDLCHCLAWMAEGRPGRAVQLAHQGGVAMLDAVLDLLSEPKSLTPPALHKTADQLAKRGAEENFALFGELVCWVLYRTVRFALAPPKDALANHSSLVGREVECRTSLLKRAPAEAWLKAHDAIRTLLQEGAQANLDRKASLLSIGSVLQQPAA